MITFRQEEILKDLDNDIYIPFTNEYDIKTCMALCQLGYAEMEFTETESASKRFKRTKEGKALLYHYENNTFNSEIDSDEEEWQDQNMDDAPISAFFDQFEMID